MKRGLALVLACLALVAGCAREPAERADDADPTPRPRPLPENAKSSKDVDPVFHVGQQIFVTDDGFKPETLVAIVDEEISWTNETDETVEIEFTNDGFESGPIEPGEKATYTSPNAQAITYALVGSPKTRAFIQVEPYFDPGEDPAAPDRIDADDPSDR